MSFTTKTDLTRFALIRAGETAFFDGSIFLNGTIFGKGIEINTTGLSSPSSDDVLTYNGITNAYEPQALPDTDFGSNRVVFGMDVTNNSVNRLGFDVSAGRYLISGTSYNTTATTVYTSSGHSTFDRYDLIYVTGGTGYNDVLILEGTPANPPIIPNDPNDSLILAIALIPSGQTSGGTAPDIITVNKIAAKNVSYNRGPFSNVAEFLDANYVYPKVLSFTNTLGDLEFGQTATTVTLNWETNKTVREQEITPTGYTPTVSLRTLNLVGEVITGNTGSTAYTYTLAYNDGINTATTSTSIPFYGLLHYGSFSSTTINTTGNTVPVNQLLALTGGSTFMKTLSGVSFSIDGNGQRLAFGYPSTFPSAKIYVNGIYCNDFIEIVQNHTNQFNYTIPYRIYISNITTFGTNLNIELK